jgi:four helix bundle protein
MRDEGEILEIGEFEIGRDKNRGLLPFSRADQLSRASLSIPLNIAEGNGRFRPNDRRQFFTVARGSAFECVPILQLLKRQNLITQSLFDNFYSQLQVLAKMLSSLILREESKAKEHR